MSKKYFSNKYSKILALNSLLEIFNEKMDPKNELILHTANGIYIGTLKNQVANNDLTVQPDDDFISIYQKTYLKTINSYENSDKVNKTEMVVENPISISLENVKILTGNQTINLPFVEVFIDQIIGFSLGSIPE